LRLSVLQASKGPGLARSAEPKSTIAVQNPYPEQTKQGKKGIAAPD